MKKYSLLALLLAVATLGIAKPTADDPFYPDFDYQQGAVRVTFAMTPGQHIYDDMLVVTPAQTLQKPAATKDADGRDIYEGAATFSFPLEAGKTFTFEYQGCDAKQCYMPQSYELIVRPTGEVVLAALEAAATPAAPVAAPGVAQWPEEARRTTGFVAAGAFKSFLRGEGEATLTSDPVAYVKQHGLALFILLIFLGGIALNLTPCVLPMIPINLAIIGAGASGGSRARGAVRGGAYGLGIAMSYGLLALIPALTGSAFGTIQSSPWFNLAVAVVFVVLALALFDLFMIDFTRFAGQGSNKQGLLAAFVAGAVSAILAGACVAPVLIAVLLLTANYFAQGAYWALCLPFVLGLGMGSPWPIAGAGLSFLPKPGQWMVWVKRIFGVFVLLFAAYYAYVAIHTWTSRTDAPAEQSATTLQGDASQSEALRALLQQAQAQGKPVLLDFWGTACKNCEVMDATTFKDPEVLEVLQDMTLVRVKMELTDPAIKPVQDAFKILGLPTYIILK